ncbi:MAG: hypothetical protein ACLSTI_01030 [Ruminococcus sp.]
MPSLTTYLAELSQLDRIRLRRIAIFPVFSPIALTFLPNCDTI